MTFAPIRLLLRDQGDGTTLVAGVITTALVPEGMEEMMVEGEASVFESQFIAIQINRRHAHHKTCPGERIDHMLSDALNPQAWKKHWSDSWGTLTRHCEVISPQKYPSPSDPPPP